MDLQALTVGVGTVMDAKEVLVLITGAGKAFALYKVTREVKPDLTKLTRP